MTPAEARELVEDALARAVEAADHGDPDAVRTWARWAAEHATAWYYAEVAERDAEDAAWRAAREVTP